MGTEMVALILAFLATGVWASEGPTDLCPQEETPGLVEGKLLRPSSPFTAESPFRVVALSPSGTLIAGFNGARELHVWDRRTGRPVLVDKESHPLGLSEILFLDPESFVTAGLEGRILVFRPNSGQGKPEEWPVWGARELGGVLDPTFLSLTDQGLLVARSHRIALLDKKKGAVLRRFEVPRAGTWVQNSPFRGFVASPDGRRFYTAAENILEWDVASGKPTAALTSPAKPFACLALSPDSQQLLSSGEKASIEEWDLATQKARRFATPEEWSESRVLALTYGHLPGQTFALLELGVVLEFQDGILKEWHRVTDRKVGHGSFVVAEKVLIAGESGEAPFGAPAPLATYRIVVWGFSTASDTSSGPVYRLFATRDGKRLLTVMSERNRLYSWPAWEDVPVPIPDGVRPNSPLINSTVMDASGMYLFLGMQRSSVAKWNVAEKRIELELGVRKPPESIALSGDDSLLASAASRTVDLFDARSGADRGSITLKGAEVSSLALGRTGAVIAIGETSQSGSAATFWDARKREMLFRSAVDGGTPRFRFDPSEKAVWASDGTNVLYRWTLDDGRWTRLSVAKPIQALCPLTDSRLLAASGGSLLVLDATSGSILEKKDVEKDAILDIVLIPEQRTVITASRDGSVRSWLLKTR